MNVINFLVPGLVGGAIGYFTNWLAIKMLFRPYEAKYVFGRKIPFTPGLIPKEHDRIAKSVGRTIEDYLLSPQAIKKSYQDRKLNETIDEEIRKKYRAILYEDYSLGDILDKFDGIIDRQEMKKDGFKLLSEGDFVKKILSRVKSLIKNYAEEEDYKSLSIYLEKLLLSDQGLNFIAELIEGITPDNLDLAIGDFLGEKNIQSLHNLVDEKHVKLAYKISKILEKNQIKDEIISLIRNLLESNVSGVIANLLPSELLANKGYESILTYLDSPKGEQDIRKLGHLLIENLSKKNTGDIYSLLSKGMDNREFLERLRKLLIEKKYISKQLTELFISLDSDLILDQLFNRIEVNLYSFENKKKIYQIYSTIYDKVMEIRVNNMLLFFKIDEEKAQESFRKIIEDYIDKDLENLVEKLEISTIVESAIGDFDYAFTEKLILDIADKELKAITYVGGVLGLIIGLISPLLQMI